MNETSGAEGSTEYVDYVMLLRLSPSFAQPLFHPPNSKKKPPGPTWMKISVASFQTMLSGIVERDMDTPRQWKTRSVTEESEGRASEEVEEQGKSGNCGN